MKIGAKTSVDKILYVDITSLPGAGVSTLKKRKQKIIEKKKKGIE